MAEKKRKIEYSEDRDTGDVHVTDEMSVSDSESNEEEESTTDPRYTASSGN